MELSHSDKKNKQLDWDSNPIHYVAACLGKVPNLFELGLLIW